METHRLTAEPRSDKGKSAVKRMRREGKIPAVLYGKGQGGVPLSLGGKDVFHFLATPGATTNILELEISESGKNLRKNVIVKKVQRHPFREEILHMDFLEVAMDKEISVMVPIETLGESKGVKEGGILEMKRRDLEVVCLPGRIPNTIAIDITPLEVGDAIHVEDIVPPAGVRIVFEHNFPLLSVVTPAVEAAPAEAEEEGVEGEAPEGEAEGKEGEESSED